MAYSKKYCEQFPGRCCRAKPNVVTRDPFVQQPDTRSASVAVTDLFCSGEYILVITRGWDPSDTKGHRSN